MTDEQILTITGQLWRQNGGAAFTMEQLAAATGVSRATLYRRFGSREAILQRLAAEQTIEAEELSRPDVPTRILQAARSIFSRYGFVGVTIEQIAQEAGVGPATIYRHFGSREGLIEKFVQLSRPRELLRTFTSGQPRDLEADLVMLATTMLEFVQENPALLRVMLFEGQGSEVLREQMRSTQERTASRLAAYLAEQMAMGNLERHDPFELALSFMGMLFGLSFVGPHSYNRPLADPHASAQLVTRIFLNGLAQPQLRQQLQQMEKLR
ncbi:MAG: TetR family transcriptional regulator [Caldilineaceae bacterium]|nr:TetR family transcriptional regulator [Caldilineaceae bacterium]